MTTWRDSAACRGMDTDTFYPPDGIRGRAKDAWIARAVTICNACPVVRQCYAEAVSRPDRWGIWGGQVMETRTRDEPAPRACRDCHQSFIPEHGGQRYCQTHRRPSERRVAA